MREFQMKKIIATAVAMAFVAPVYAADITITGDMEFSWRDNNGTTTAESDGDFNVKASTETANGFSVAADININELGADDGGNSITIGGPFGTLDLGDTSSAVDAVDDTTDWGYELTNGSTNYDASVLWTLPTMVPGLSVYVSTGADNNGGSSDGANHTGISAKYSVSGLSVSYGSNDNDDGTEVSIVAVTYGIDGLGLAAETLTETAADGTETDTELFAATYTMGDLTVAVETMDNGTNDVTSLGAHYSLGGGVTAFIEQTDDANVAATEATAVGVAMKF
jgi:hypothetical protein